MEVSSPPGNVIGTIQQKWNIIGLPRFDVKDASGDVTLKIEGPFCRCTCGWDINFKAQFNEFHYTLYIQLQN